MSFQFMLTALILQILTAYTKGQCDDKLPADAPFDCPTYLKLGLCTELPDEFCQSSCSRCTSSGSSTGSSECEDIEISGVTCADVVASGICNEATVKGVFCAKSCSNCQDVSDTTAESIPPPSPPLTERIADSSPPSPLSVESPPPDPFVVNLLVESPPPSPPPGPLMISSPPPTPSTLSVESPPPPPGPLVSSSPPAPSTLLVESPPPGPLVSSSSPPPPVSPAQEISPSASASPSTPRVATSGDCESLDAIECDLEALQALSPFFNEITDPCTEVTGIICKDNRVTNISIGQVTNSFNFDTAYAVIEADRTDSSIDLQGQQIPAEFSKLRYLQRFEVEGTGLGGSIPPEVSTLSRMVLFDIDGDQITGTLPVELSTWQKLQWFDASFCQLTGTLPGSYSEWQDVVLIDISEGPKFTGSLPAEWSTMDNLQYLYLNGGGQYTGTVPAEWSTLEDNLYRLYFGTQDKLCIDLLQWVSLVDSFVQKNGNFQPGSDTTFLETC